MLKLSFRCNIYSDFEVNIEYFTEEIIINNVKNRS
jgi:hypothetical protein